MDIFNAKKRAKPLAIILICLLMLSVFSGCDIFGGNDETSSDNSEEATSEVKTKIDSFYVNEVNREKELVCVSLEKEYTTVGGASANKDGVLTDGLYATDDKSHTGWAVFDYSSEIEITVNLGSITEGICSFNLNMLQIIRENVFYAEEITVYISIDGEDYIQIGLMNRLNISTEIAAKPYVLNLSGGVKASHIKFVVKSSKSANAYIDEVGVFAYGDKDKEAAVLPEYKQLYSGKIPQKITEPVFWDKSEADYTKVQNLVSGRIPEAFTMKVDLTVEQGNSPESDLYKLTDGKYVSAASYADTALFWGASPISNTDGRLFIFDLEKTSAITGFKTRFAAFASVAVFLPDSFVVYTSENGEAWDIIYRRDGIRDENMASSGIVSIEHSFDQKHLSRFVAVFFDIEGNTRFDEIEIYGTKSTEGAVPVSEKGNTRFFGGKFPAPEEVNGISNALLMYHSYAQTLNYTSEHILSFDEEYMSKLLAYHDRDDSIKDTYFDTFMFLGGGDTLEWTKAEMWTAYKNNLFETGKNLDALNSAAIKVGEALGRDNFKAKVILTLFLPSERFTDFGDVDGDGVNEDLSTLEGKKKVMDWHVDEYIKRFNDAGYTNLELAGFYWHDEVVRYTDLHLPAAIRYTTDKVHDSGDYIMMACPYFHASGFYDWHNLGFDLVILQPSYYFWNRNEVAIPKTVAMAKLLGYGVEMEVEPNATTEIEMLDAHIEYLRGGVNYGYMDAVHMYYYSKPYYVSCNAKGELGRQLYELNYRFVLGTLEFTSGEDIYDEVYECEVNGSVNKKLGIKGISQTLASSTKYGTLKFNNDGKFVYTPAEGFKGEDSFFVEVRVTGADKVLYEVRIKVGN